MPDPVRLNGMTSAAAAMEMLQKRQQVLSNNLANVSTKGFKAESAFARMMDNAMVTADTALDQRNGSLTETHNAFDLAVDGKGFFVVQTAKGERLVRGGSFQLDADRRLIDGQGNPVLGDAGPITLPPGKVEIDKSGMLSVDGKPQQRLRVEEVADSARLQHEDGVRFLPDATRKSLAPESRTVKQGFLEESNVNAMEAMTDMLAVLHRFGAAQKTISTLDSARGIAVTELAKPV